MAHGTKKRARRRTSAPARAAVTVAEIEAALAANRPVGLPAPPDSADSWCAESGLQPGMTVFQANEGHGPMALHVAGVVDLYEETRDGDLEGVVRVSGVCAFTGGAYSYRICGDNLAELVTPQLARDLGVIANDTLND